jgi:hypothetical protein
MLSLLPPIGPAMRIRPGKAGRDCVSPVATIGVGGRSSRTSSGVGTGVAGTPPPKNGIDKLAPTDGVDWAIPIHPSCALPVGEGWGVFACDGVFSQNRLAGVGESVGRGVGENQTGALVDVGVEVDGVGTGTARSPAVAPGRALVVPIGPAVVVAVGRAALLDTVGTGVAYWAARAGSLSTVTAPAEANRIAHMTVGFPNAVIRSCRKHAGCHARRRG